MQGLERVVARPQRFLGIAVEQRVVHSERRAARDVLGERKILLVVVPARLGRDEGERAEHTTSGGERHDHRGAQPELAEHLEQLRRVAGRLDEELVRNVRGQLRLASSDHVRDAHRCVGIDGILLGQLVRPLDLLRVGVGDREPFDRAPGADEVDRAPVRELRHRERRDVRQCLFVVERGGQRLGRLGEEAPVLGGACLRLVELSGADRGPGESRQRHGDLDLVVLEAPERAEVEDERPLQFAGGAKRRDEHRPDSLGSMRLAVRLLDPVDLLEVLCDQRAVEVHRPAADRLGRVLAVRLGDPFGRGERPGVCCEVAQPESVPIRGEDALREIDHGGENAGNVQRGEERARLGDEQRHALGDAELRRFGRLGENASRHGPAWYGARPLGRQ